jgi:hypothetical protein
MEEWEEFQRFERWQAIQPVKEPEPEPVNPHLAYTQGPAGQTIVDWKAFGGNPTPEQLEIHSTAPDRRDNRDPEEVYRKLVASRKTAFVDSGDEIDYNGPVVDVGEIEPEIKVCWQGKFYPHTPHLWVEDRPGGQQYWCPGANEDSA